LAFHQTKNQRPRLGLEIRHSEATEETTYFHRMTAPTRSSLLFQRQYIPQTGGGYTRYRRVMPFNFVGQFPRKVAGSRRHKVDRQVSRLQSLKLVARPVTFYSRRYGSTQTSGRGSWNYSETVWDHCHQCVWGEAPRLSPACLSSVQRAFLQRDLGGRAEFRLPMEEILRQAVAVIPW